MLKAITIILLLFCSSIIFADNDTNDYYFAKHQFSIGIYNKHILPDDIPHPPHPLFWKSRLKIHHGVTFIYEYLVFHTKKYFSVNLVGSLSRWVANSQAQYALSFLFELRFWLFRTNSFNPYITYSIGGPTLLTRRNFADANLGARFIFQDFIGIGALIGKTHHIDISLKLYHYSNGDLFLHNDGFDVPVVLTIGYAF